ncbi:MAG: ABC transporter permease [Chloroflexi bacterium]|nr:ABC transporter permease [Chloroflexota bacterium]
MGRYILHRLLIMVPTALGGLLALFVIFRVLPGDPVLMMLGGGEGGSVDQRAYATLRAQLNLDQPIPLQFVTWLGAVMQGDLGMSYMTGHPVVTEIFLRFPTSVALMLMALAITIVLSVPMGILAALRQNSVLDYLLRIVGLSGLSMPPFWIGMLLILMLTTFWQWYPPAQYAPPYRDPWLAFQQLIFPALVLGFRPVGVALRVLRSSVLEELRSDYARTATAKGVRARLVIWRHILPNSFLPTLTYFGLEAAALLGGSAVVESIFNVPGVGQLLIQALQRRDFPLVQGIMMTTLAFVMGVNLLVDVLYGFFDPRIRY